jgi:deoxycytidylate deaminase
MAREEALLVRIEKPELFFGIVAPIGVDIDEFISTFEKEIRSFQYEPYLIRVTDWITRLAPSLNSKVVDTPLEKRYKTYIHAGNALRTKIKFDPVLAALATMQIREIRRRKTGHQTPIQGAAYIIRQFKRPEEIDLLRSIYGEGFFQISIQASREDRLEALARKIAASHSDERNLDKYRDKAESLIVQDEAEEDEIHGQRVRATFPLADFVVEMDKTLLWQDSLKRFLKLIFGHNFTSPTADERGQYFAHAASLSSIDLSRQVGAVITDTKGDIISVGYNDVPKAGGGLYGCEDSPDGRDYRQVGADPNEIERRKLIEDMLKRLSDAKWLSDDNNGKAISDLTARAISKSPPGVLSAATIMDIIEFGRIVHAEMAAITSAARQGRSLAGATLHCTTFPCHLCAKHIVSSGIKRVTYIEPYPKSLVRELYPDSIFLGDMESENKVAFAQFKGIAPARYRSVFAIGKRKNSKGVAQEWRFGKPQPYLSTYLPTHLALEAAAIQSLERLCRGAGINLIRRTRDRKASTRRRKSSRR